MKKIVIVNTGSRSGCNTDILLKEVEKGALENGNEIIRFDPARKQKRYEEIFHLECKEVFDI